MIREIVFESTGMGHLANRKFQLAVGVLPSRYYLITIQKKRD